MKLKLNIKSNKPKLKVRGKKLKLNIKSNKPKLKVKNSIRRYKLKSYIKNSKEILRVLSQCKAYKSGQEETLHPSKTEASFTLAPSMLQSYMTLIEENRDLLLKVEYGKDWVKLLLKSLVFPNSNYTHSILFKHHGPAGVKGKR